MKHQILPINQRILRTKAKQSESILLLNILFNNTNLTDSFKLRLHDRVVSIVSYKDRLNFRGNSPSIKNLCKSFLSTMVLKLLK